MIKCRVDEHALLVVHRDLVGKHDDENMECWCIPCIFCPICEPEYVTSDEDVRWKN